MNPHKILVAGHWRPARTAGTFHAFDPSTGKSLEEVYPISTWEDCDEALDVAARAAVAMRETSPEILAAFLNEYAKRIEANRQAIVAHAALETALPAAPRLSGIELPRTASQLRQAATAAMEGSWASATIDSKLNIRSMLAPIGPVVILGPNNFPLAFNAISGGDFAAAIAAGNPVIAKAHPSHPGTTRLLSQSAAEAASITGLPEGAVQMIYDVSRADGLRLVADPRVGATAFTGSRTAGMALKASADAAGRPIYLEMSSLNPVVILPGALAERSEKIADELADSALAASGQFCTKPGIAILIDGEAANAFVTQMSQRFSNRKPGPLLSADVGKSLASGIAVLVGAGAKKLVDSPSTLLKVSGDQFLKNPDKLQTEAFGNASMLLIASNLEQATQIIEHLEGNLTGSIYSARDGLDDAAYATISRALRPRVGRLINDKMPTGVAVSPAMNHGGPFPSTGHPGFTAVGIPASMRRFAMLECFDNVRAERLPAALRDRNPNANMWRNVDGSWIRG